MDLYVLNAQYSVIGIVDSYKSLIWTKRYFEFGDCEVYIPATIENRNILAVGNILMRNDDSDMICRITSVELDTDIEKGDYLIVVGEDCRAILDQRIVYPMINYSGKIEGLFRRMITENFISPTYQSAKRTISNMTIATDKGFNDTIEAQITWDSIGAKIIDICRSYGIGTKLKLNNSNNFVFEAYKGVNRSYGQSVNPFVVFSSDYDNLSKTIYKLDTSNYRSIAVVAGEGEGMDRYVSETGIATDTGINRRELYVDAKSTRKDISYNQLTEMYPNGTLTGTTYYSADGVAVATVDDATEPTDATLYDSVYAELLNSDGKDELTNHESTTLFEGEVEPNYSYKYGTDYLLGDVVQIMNQYGISVGARITEVIESWSDKGYQIIPTFEFMG